MSGAPARTWVSAAVLALLTLSACAVNPVTGERNFQVYGSDWERQVGDQMYAPMKQSQGGEFILDPDLTAYVKQVGDRLAARSRREGELDYEFSVLNDSVPNAWALPGGKIVINRGLLAALESEAELAAVLGHEIVHADASHGARAQSKAMLTQTGAIISMVVLGSTIDSQSAREVAMMVPALGAQLLTQKYGRDAEREADEYGMLYMSEAGYDPQGAVKLQETFVELSEGREQDWLSGLFASHPASQERVADNRARAARLPAGGEMGVEEFRRHTAYLRRVQPAYEAYDEAGKAIAEDQLGLAQERLNEAMSLEPRESLFHGLQGDIHALNDRPEQALASYESAIKANPGLFYGHLRKGQVAYRLDRGEQARASLQQSLELLPTAEAHYLLGMLDQKAGQLDSAVEHFRLAADSKSESGQQAARELVVLDLPANPSKYIASRLAVDRQNSVWVQFGNLTSVAVRDIEISYAWLDEQGRTRQAMTSYAGPLGAGKKAQMSLGIQLGAPAELERRVRAQVTAARPAE
jgi:predicted Zn-dependent protease